MIKNRITDEYRRSAKRYNDAPAKVDMRQSIKEMREIYSSLTDDEFIQMYAQRYNFRPADVAEFLDKIRAEENADQ